MHGNYIEKTSIKKTKQASTWKKRATASQNICSNSGQKRPKLGPFLSTILCQGTVTLVLEHHVMS